MPDYATYLESAFPFVKVSRLVAADRRAPDPAYQAHRWWARRPPALVRAALLGATRPANTSPRSFWRTYANPEPHLAGLTVSDPFLGGGTTLVEAARLGARAVGTDVDPLAVAISHHQLSPPDGSEVLQAGLRLFARLRADLGLLWPEPDPGAWQPLHYFFAPMVTCPTCRHDSLLYRSLILARSVGLPGSVVRDAAVVAFCPDCRRPQDLDEDATALSCCDRTRRLTEATFARARYTCPACGTRSQHEELQTARARQALLAVEETPVEGTRNGRARRRIRAGDPSEQAIEAAASEWLAQSGVTTPAGVPLTAALNDQRPLSFGIDTVGRLHTSRQLAYLAWAQHLIAEMTEADEVKRALRLAVSSTITSNNRLCGYATDYGRLAPLFSVRAFALPALTVELNPLNPDGGRGTFLAALNRVGRSCDQTVKRSVFDVHGQVQPVVMPLPRGHAAHDVRCADATADDAHPSPDSGGLADVCLTDPPYFDFIAYDTLSQVYRAWHPAPALAGTPLHPDGEDAVGSFGTRLGAALAKATATCKPTALIAFTYKGNNDAWSAVGLALDEAKLRVTAMWPVLADPHMGHHASEGNCEYDMLVVARPISATRGCPAAVTSPQRWIRALRTVRKVSSADQSNMTAALSMAAGRWGTVSP
ncbi:hypothetical protein [Blastococcus sp. KM273129]|uniref:hypothetical protein n=1 Tax=Blastococcus sp. KM273129 TaxID=2570315 RepID=UPI001F41E8A6|nr:hypothetical protein [Blastococcus sp. KM273129]MCF6733710.1 DUF1156 domain-containing protein [Blastococcus sp. KM273129]